MPSQHDRILGEKIRTLREERGLGSREMSTDVGMAVNYISKVESGQRTVSLEMVERIADVLEVSPELLLRGVFHRND